MWPFKKKVKDGKKKVSGFTVPELEISKDRFVVYVCVDENTDTNTYKITVYDKWSTPYLPKKERDKGFVLNRAGIFGLDKDITDIGISMKINARIERIKSELRDDFNEARKKHLKKYISKKKKKPKIKKEAKSIN